MRVMKKIFLGLLLLSAPVLSQEKPIVIRAGTLLDGKGGIKHNVSITVEGSKISNIGSAPGITYDLRRLTVLPGLIDTHVHIAWHLGPDGRYQPRDDFAATSLGYALENAYVTLMAGFTTVQSLGSPIDRDTRDAINRGVMPGPRLLTSLRPVGNSKLTPAEIRDAVRKNKADGADVIKMFAWTGTLIDGGQRTLNNEQIAAGCSEAKALGLRSLVHVYGDEAIRSVAEAGCTGVEHGFFATDETLRVLAKHGTYFDPHIGLVMQNYLSNRSKFLGIGSYKEEEMSAMEQNLPVILSMFQRALKIPGLKIVYGTDAVAAAHGHNIEEMVYRVEKAGQQPMAAIVSATSLAAESLNLGDRIGAVTPGMQADLIALEGNPLKDITALRRIVFVIRVEEFTRTPRTDQG